MNRVVIVFVGKLVGFLASMIKKMHLYFLNLLSYLYAKITFLSYFPRFNLQAAIHNPTEKGFSNNKHA